MEVSKLTTEEKIINASFNILKTEGMAKATTKKIAERAGVSEITIFRKFKSKKNLIQVVKDKYVNYLLDKLDEVFEYDENIETREYLTGSFKKIVNLSNNEINVVKVALEEVIYVKMEKKLLPVISDRVLTKLTDYFQLQIDKKRIKKINPNVLALNVFSMMFESLILWKVYGIEPKYDIDVYIDDFLDIILNGISIRGE